jgi:hypothetical protein
MKKIVCFLVIFCLSILKCSLFAASPQFDELHIPPEYGTITGEAHGTEEKVIFLISDIHNNLSAQKSIADLIEYLVDYYGFDFIGLEGARGEVKTDDLSSYYSTAVRKAVGLYYMQKAFLGGGVYNDITSEHGSTFYGLEDRELYEKQFQMYRSSYEKRAEVIEQIDKLEDILERFKKELYPKELFEIEESLNEYHNDQLSLLDFGNLLLSVVTKYRMSIAQYPTLMLLNDIRVIEGQIDYALLGQEEKSLIGILQEKVGRDIHSLVELKEAREHYSAQRISEDEYLDTLYDLAIKHKIDSVGFENMWRMFQRVSMLKKIDSIVLYEEIDTLYPLIQQRLLKNYSNSTFEELLALSTSLTVLKRVVTLNATSEDLERYFKQKDDFSSPRFISFIRENAMKNNVSYRIDRDIVRIDRIDTLLGEYYDLSHARSRMMFTNLISGMDERGKKNALMVVGKFHVPDILNECQKKNITCIQINPYVPRLRETIDISARLRAPQSQLKGYIMSYLQHVHLKPWEVLSPYEHASDLFFRELLKAEFLAHDITTRLEAYKEFTAKNITRELYELQRAVSEPAFQDTTLLHIIELPMINKTFVDIRIGTGENALRLLVEPLRQRGASYADETVAQISPLNIEELSRGLFRSSDRLVNVLQQEYAARVFSYEAELVPAIQDEIAASVSQKKQEKERLRQKVEPLPVLPGQVREREEDAINERLNKIKEIEARIDKAEGLDELNSLDNEFVLLQSQLSFYPISETNKAYITYVEQKISAQIGLALERLKTEEREKKELEELQQKKDEAELRMKEAIESKRRRKELDALIEQVAVFQKEIEQSNTLLELNALENNFNELIASLNHTDLAHEDKVILNAFKISWEAKYTALQKAATRERLQNRRGSSLSGTSPDLIQAYIQQAYNLKEIVDFASIPSDAAFIKSEYESLKEHEYYAQLNPDEKELFDAIGNYILEIEQDLKKGKKKDRRLSLMTLSLGETEDSDIYGSDDYFGHIYELRTRVMSARSLDELNVLYSEFNAIDTGIKQRDLTEHQKTVLADTERMIREAIQLFEKQRNRQSDLAKEELDRQKEIEKEAFLRELLGEADSASLQPAKIFFIEDNAFERDLVSKRLDKEGFRVHATDSYNYDNAYFLANDFDLILIDDDIINNTTGLDFVIRLKRNERIEALPPIVIHSNNSISWLYGFLKRNGITRRSNVFVTSKRDLGANIELIRKVCK